MKISQQGYLQQRKRLNPDIFSTMNDEYLIDFYESGEAKLWSGCLLLTMDGSKAEVSDSQENRECFGTMTKALGICSQNTWQRRKRDEKANG